MKEEKAVKRARAEFKALRLRHRREHEQARKKLGRACDQLAEKVTTLKQGLLAYHSSPRVQGERARRVRIVSRCIDLCATVQELITVGHLQGETPWDDEMTKRHFDKAMSICKTSEELLAVRSALYGYNEQRDEIFRARVRELMKAEEVSQLH